MRDNTWRRTGLPFGDAAHNLGHRKTTTLSRSEALGSLGPVVYAARLADGTIKLGWTANFKDRMRHLSHASDQDVELLGFRVGTRADELLIHKSLAAHRIKGKREYYHPAEAVLTVVNNMRDSLGLPEIAA